jgi:hypothetical protein
MFFTPFARNNFLSKDIMISVLETFFPFLELLVTPRELRKLELPKR